MLIEVTASIRFRYEEKNYMIERLRIVKEGKNAGAEVWDVVAYCSSFRAAADALLSRYFHLLVDEPDKVKDLRSLIDAVDYGADLIARACQQVKEG